jgi:threonine dehydrogenase-like Zn-dependent dehydrogenase
MKQIVLRAPGEFVERQVVRPSALAGEALVRMRRVGVCGSDFHALAGRHPIYTYPRVLGHELAGEIVETDPMASSPMSFLTRLVTRSL